MECTEKINQWKMRKVLNKKMDFLKLSGCTRYSGEHRREKSTGFREWFGNMFIISFLKISHILTENKGCDERKIILRKRSFFGGSSRMEENSYKNILPVITKSG